MIIPPAYSNNGPHNLIMIQLITNKGWSLNLYINEQHSLKFVLGNILISYRYTSVIHFSSTFCLVTFIFFSQLYQVLLPVLCLSPHRLETLSSLQQLLAQLLATLAILAIYLMGL